MSSGGLPPPPTKAESGSFAWIDWYQKLSTYLNASGSVPWAVVDKAGSSLGDLQTRAHANLTAVAGTGSSHLSTTEAARVTITMTLQSKAGDPTTTDITASNWALYKNTTSGLVKLWVNDGGTMKSTLLA
jgi:hypothetical protein